MEMDLAMKTFSKKEIEEDINKELTEALEGTKRLHEGVRNGVYLALRYYRELLRKIEKTPAEKILQSRFRISGFQKMLLLVRAWIRNKIGKIR